jgi:hypothetical protein
MDDRYNVIDEKDKLEAIKVLEDYWHLEVVTILFAFARIPCSLLQG